MRRHVLVVLGFATALGLGTHARGDNRDVLELPALVAGQPGEKKDPASGPAPPPLEPVPIIEYEEVGTREPRSLLQISGGGGLYIIRPFFETNPAYASVTTTFGPPTTVSNRTQEDFRQNLDGAPVGWLGVSFQEGFGVKARYFGYAQGTGFSILTPAATAGAITTFYTPYPEGLGITNGFGTILGDRFDFFSDLKIQSWDMEVTRSWFGEFWQVQASAGARLAHLSQDYSARFSPGPNNLFAAFVDVQSGHNFNGAGPLLAFEGYVDIGNTGFSLFCNTRNALLFGRAKNGATRVFTDQITGVATAIDTANRVEEDLLPVSEVELGVELGRRIGGRARLYVQAGVVGQMWWGAGNATNSAHITGTSFPDEAHDAGSNLGMMGFLIRGGFDF